MHHTNTFSNIFPFLFLLALFLSKQNFNTYSPPLYFNFIITKSLSPSHKISLSPLCVCIHPQYTGGGGAHYFNKKKNYLKKIVAEEKNF